MPNWVTNRLKVKGNDVADIIESLINEEGEMDFNKVIPMPQLLINTEASSGVETIYEEIEKHYTTIPSLAYLKQNMDVVDTLAHKAFSKWSEDMIQRAIEKTLLSVECMEKYGYLNWYDWSNRNWGCKWNASNTDVDNNGEVIFDTPWATPEPVIKALSKKYPNNTFVVEYADEDYGNNCGRYTFRNGKMTQRYYPKTIKCGQRWVDKHFYAN